MIVFVEELISLINKYSLENGSNTPDSVLGNFMVACLEAFDAATNTREKLSGHISECQSARAGHCPECNGRIKYRCKCFRSDSGCENGHHWHYCTAHLVVKLVMGPYDHSKSSNECSCEIQAGAEARNESEAEIQQTDGFVILFETSDYRMVAYKTSKKNIFRLTLERMMNTGEWHPSVVIGNTYLPDMNTGRDTGLKQEDINSIRTMILKSKSEKTLSRTFNPMHDSLVDMTNTCERLLNIIEHKSGSVN